MVGLIYYYFAAGAFLASTFGAGFDAECDDAFFAGAFVATFLAFGALLGVTCVVDTTGVALTAEVASTAPNADPTNANAVNNAIIAFIFDFL